MGLTSVVAVIILALSLLDADTALGSKTEGCWVAHRHPHYDVHNTLNHWALSE
jgi:hypothetical protein